MTFGILPGWGVERQGEGLGAPGRSPNESPLGLSPESKRGCHRKHGSRSSDWDLQLTSFLADTPPRSHGMTELDPSPSYFQGLQEGAGAQKVLCPWMEGRARRAFVLHSLRCPLSCDLQGPLARTNQLQSLCFLLCKRGRCSQCLPRAAVRTQLGSAESRGRPRGGACWN